MSSPSSQGYRQDQPLVRYGGSVRAFSAAKAEWIGRVVARLDVVFLIGLAAVAFTASPLFFLRSFYWDWFNHAWLIAHYADYIAENIYFPAFLDADNIDAGFPAFYGFLFYPVVGMLSRLMGVDAGLRVLCALLMLGIYSAQYRFALKLTKSRTVSLLAAISPVLAIYNLTNLYNRSAITEFFGTGFLHLSCLFFLSWVISLRNARGIREGFACLNAAFLFAALVIGTHPITAFLALVCLVLPIVAIIIAARISFGRSQLILLLAMTLVCVVHIFPWLIATVTMGDKIDNVQSGLIYHLGSIDSPLTRLFSLPFDLRYLTGPFETISTPHLEAPATTILLAISVPLSVGVVLVVRQMTGRWPFRFGLAAAILHLWVVFLLVVSLDQALWTDNAAVATIIQALFYRAQFIYRIVSDINLVLLLGILLPFLIGEPIRSTAQALLHRRSLQFLVAAAIITISTATFVKIAVIVASNAAVHRNVELTRGNIRADYDSIISQPRVLPPTFYGAHGYAMLSLFRPLQDGSLTERKEVRLVHRHGWPTRSEEIAVECIGKCLIRTNIIPSGFVRLLHNGQWRTPQDLLWVDGYVAIEGVPGTNRLQFAVDRNQFLALNGVAFSWIAWAVLSLGVPIFAIGWRAGTRFWLWWTWRASGAGGADHPPQRAGR